MSQVSLLSVDVAQTPDLKGAKGDSSIIGQAKSSAFSDAMEQHYPKKEPAVKQTKSEENGNSASKAANNQPPVDKSTIETKQVKSIEVKSDGPISKPEAEKVNTDKIQVDKPLATAGLDSRNAHVLSVPSPIDNLALIEQLKSTDDGQILPLPLPIDDKSLTTDLSTKLKLVDNAEILPVAPTVNGEQLVAELIDAESEDTLAENKPLDTGHLIAKIARNNDAEILPIPVSPLNAEVEGNEESDKVLKPDVIVTNTEKKPAVDLSFHAQIKLQEGQPSNVLVKESETDDAVDLLKMLNGAKNFITKKATEVSASEPTIKNDVLKVDQSSASAKQLLETNKLMVEQDTSVKSSNNDLKPVLKISGAEQKVNSTIENVVLDKVINESKVISKPDGEGKEIVFNLEAGIKKVDDKRVKAIVDSTKSTGLNSGMNNTVLFKEKRQTIGPVLEPSNELAVKNMLVNDDLEKMAASENNEFEQTSSKGVLNQELIVESKKTATESPNVNVQGNNVQSEAQPNKVDLKTIVDNEVLQPRTINQSTATVIHAATSRSQGETEQKITTKEVLEKSAVGDSEKLAKIDNDKLMPQADKIASAFNQTLDAQATKSMISPSELAMQQEQSFESITNKITTSTVQTQKSITALNAETIAIYRKDFANAVKDKVMVMINQKIQQVEIQLDPPEMGNIHIRVNLQNEQAAVQFVVQNQQAKDALEQNMGKLREMLAESGVDVGDANIEQRQAKEQNGEGTNEGNTHGQNGELADSEMSENDNSVMNVVKASSTGVDYYA